MTPTSVRRQAVRRLTPTPIPHAAPDRFTRPHHRLLLRSLRSLSIICNLHAAPHRAFVLQPASPLATQILEVAEHELAALGMLHKTAPELVAEARDLPLPMRLRVGTHPDVNPLLSEHAADEPHEALKRGGGVLRLVVKRVIWKGVLRMWCEEAVLMHCFGCCDYYKLDLVLVQRRQ
jgi:hypothetical protein